MLTLIFGRRKQGKTTLAYSISLRSPTRIIFDPRGQFRTTDDILPSADGLFELLDTRSEIIVQPEDAVKHTFSEVCREFANWIKANPEETAILLDDEALFIDTPSETYSSLDKIIRFGNPQRTGVIMTAHRPGDISVDIRAIADYWCIFKTTQEHDLKVIDQRCGSQVAEIVSRLEAKQYVVWNDAEGVFAVKTNPSAWYVNIERKSETVPA